MVTISLPNDQRARFRKCLRAAGRREIGGILMGEQVAPDHFRIVDFSVDDKTGTAAHFVRSPEHHSEALDSFFRRTGSDFKRFNYLGDVTWGRGKVVEKFERDGKKMVKLDVQTVNHRDEVTATAVAEVELESRAS